MKEDSTESDLTDLDIHIDFRPNKDNYQHSFELSILKM